MAYAPGILEFIERCNRAMPPDFYKLPVAEQRRLYLGLTVEFPYAMPAGVQSLSVEMEHNSRSHRCRLYVPAQRSGKGLILYIRGGGFVVGSLDTHATVCAELSDKSGLITLAPDFRMAPESSFPAALEDCYEILELVASNAERFAIDPSQIVIAGDSSGANMAVAVAMMSRDRVGPPLRGQCLISPVLDFTRWRKGGADAPLLTGGEMEYYTACYVPRPEDAAHPYVSPLKTARFSGLPPAYIMGAELDPLLADAEEYARRLRQNGTPVELVVEPGLVHSAVRARGLCPQVADAWARFCRKAAELATTDSVSADFAKELIHAAQ